MHVALPAATRSRDEPTLRLEDLRGEAWVQTSASSPCARHVVRSCHAAGLRADRVVRERRLPDRPGPGRGGRRRGADPAARAVERARRHRVRALHPQGPVRRVVAATPAADGARSPAATLMLEVLEEVARAYRTRDLASGRVATRGDCAGVPLGAQPGTPRREAERRDVRGVDLVAVDREVALLHVLLGHPQRHEQADELEQDERPDRREARSPTAPPQLPLEQRPVAVDQARDRDVRRPGPGRGTTIMFGSAKIAGQQAAGEPGEPVRVDHAERVVDVAERAAGG